MFTVTVNSHNRHWFENMVPVEFISDTELERHFVLAAVGENENGQYAAGVICFDIADTLVAGEEILAAELKWLYVAQQFRRQGAAQLLMDQFFTLAANAGISVALCDVPTDGEYLELVDYLENWGFEFSLDTRYEVRTSLERLKLVSPLWRTPSQHTLPLSALSHRMFKTAAEAIDALPYTSLDLEQKITACDRDISCVYIKDKKLFGCGIAYAPCSNIIEICFLRAFDRDNSKIGDMMCFMAAAAAKKYGPETEICYDCYTAHAIEFTDRYLPEIQPPLVYRGACLTIEPEED